MQNLAQTEWDEFPASPRKPESQYSDRDLNHSCRENTDERQHGNRRHTPTEHPCPEVEYEPGAKRVPKGMGTDHVETSPRFPKPW